PHWDRHSILGWRLCGQVVNLLVAYSLDSVFQATQEIVRIEQGFRLHYPDRTCPTKVLQRLPQGRSLQLSIAPPAHQLQRLHDELDLPDTAGTKLDVVL